MIWPYLQHPGTLAFAHRGGNLEAPENTRAAFAHSVDLGINYLETDVHLTKDGVIVAFHDSGLSRVAGLEGTIAEHRWSELQDVDLGGGHRIPTLDDVLESFPDTKFNIDPKSNDVVEPLATALQAHNAVTRVGIGSFSDSRISSLRQRLGPSLCTSPGPVAAVRLLLRARSGIGLRPARNGGFGCIQIPPSMGPVHLDDTLVSGLHELGLQVHVWTLNTLPEIHRILDMGVDGVMTDDPALLRSALIERDDWYSQV